MLRCKSISTYLAKKSWEQMLSALDLTVFYALANHLEPLTRYSHSIVATGLGLKSYATLLTPFTSVMMRLTILPRSS